MRASQWGHVRYLGDKVSGSDTFDVTCVWSFHHPPVSLMFCRKSFATNGFRIISSFMSYLYVFNSLDSWHCWQCDVISERQKAWPIGSPLIFNLRATPKLPLYFRKHACQIRPFQNQVSRWTNREPTSEAIIESIVHTTIGGKKKSPS